MEKKEPESESEKFEDLLSKLLHVPKKETDELEAKRKKKTRRKKKEK